MRKIISSILLTVACVMLLTGCCVKHDYAEATCESPATCTRCGETTGEALGHEMAQETLPETCIRCGYTQESDVSFKRVSLLDDWENAYLRGDTIVEANWDVNYLSLSFQFYSFDPENQTCNWVNSTGFEAQDYSYDIEKNFVLTCVLWTFETVPKISIFDMEGNTVYMAELSYNKAFPEAGGYPVASVDENGIIRIYQKVTGDDIVYLDSDYNVVKASAYTKPSNSAYEHKGWYYYEEQLNGLVLVASEDKSEWGYLDADGNVLAMYADASGFTVSGYALVSDDRESYDLIDSELNVIAKGLVSGTSASLSSICGDNVLKVKTSEETYKY